MNVPSFQKATEKGEIVNKDGYHQPDNQSRHMKNCGCSNTTKKGAYRDVTVEMPNGMIVHFYHQTPVVVKEDNRYWLNTSGYQTSTTKERINRYIPSGYKVIQRDYTWYVKIHDPNVSFDEREYEKVEFKDGMTFEV